MDIEAQRSAHYNSTVVGTRRPHDCLAVLRVRPDRPLTAYEAGQWLQVGIGMWEPRCDGCPAEQLGDAALLELVRRPYSLSSSILADGSDRLLEPNEEGWYELYVRVERERALGASGAALAARLVALEPGARLWLGERPSGTYTLREVHPGEDVLFLATGTGEAPHNRMIWELLRRGHRGRIASAVTTRRLEDLAYLAVHQRLMRRFENYRYVGVATREPDVEGRRLQEMLESGALEERAGVRVDPKHSHVFLCGNQEMLGRPRTENGLVVFPQPSGMIELLARRGYRSEPAAGSRLHFERYG